MVTVPAMELPEERKTGAEAHLFVEAAHLRGPGTVEILVVLR
jgi:hypothetical protein